MSATVSLRPHKPAVSYSETTGSISMSSGEADACATDEVPPLAKRIELKCLNRHACPPRGSADRFRETANLIVRMGLILQQRGLSRA